jgi:gliding motility-associated-like protein
MKKGFLLFLYIIASKIMFANHIIGGEIYYTYVGKGVSATSHVYKITLKLYKGGSGANLDVVVPITIFRSTSGASIKGQVYTKKYATLEGPFEVNYFSTDPCIYPPEDVNYQYGLYTVTVDLQESSYGYIIAYQRCCRDASIKNLKQPGEQGATYFTKIPGRLNATAPLSVINSSPKFSNNDSALVCRFSKFTLNFSAVDDDGDNLTYQFVAAHRGAGNIKDGIKCTEYRPDPACFPFEDCLYEQGFSETSPMGPNVTINPSTGIISGVAPGAGLYVVAVMCYEIRGSIIIGFHYKEFLIKVSAACSAVTAQLNTRPVSCDSFTVNFQNDAINNRISVDYFWNFGEPSSGVNNTSLLAAPAHTYSQAGDYKVKLKVSIGGNCADSAETIVKIYPGIRPDFDVFGECKNTAILFTDKTQADYGNITSWEWNFGDIISGFDNMSLLQNPSHVYSYANNYTINLKVESSKGCIDTVSKFITVKNSPQFSVFPKDTLICTIDTLQIGVIGLGSVQWSPNYMISNTSFQSPLVSPDVNTIYKIKFTDAFGCGATDSVIINVTDKVYQGNNYDTVICEKDPIILRLSSNALYYTWTPDNGTLSNTVIKNPTVTLSGSTATVYNVVGKISDKCFAENSITVTPVPYPVPVAPDVNVCAGESVQLQATGGSIYNWNPKTFLNNSTIPNPLAIKPSASVIYTLTVKDILGCPKPVQKTVRLNVIKINANAGPRDTSVVLGQPLQLDAGGGTSYLWLPDNRWLSNTAIGNPVALPQNNIEYIVRVSDRGCVGLDSINVKVYFVAPDLYVPNAFTPNRDGLNDIFRPVLLGIKSLDLFQVFNRFGQVIYNSTAVAKGWDGTFGGRPQESGTYLWIAKATDYTGKKIQRKGSLILIR